MRIPTLLAIVFAPGVVVLTGIEVSSQSLERTVYATVVTQAGAPVDNLLAADFVVKEDGSALNVRTVSRAVDPVDIAVLVNLGDGDIRDVRRGLADLFDAIDAPHDMALTSIARPAVRVNFTRDPDTLVRGITALSLRGDGGVNASMRDAVLDSARALQKRPPSRRVIIAVSDGSYRMGDKRADQQAALRGSGTTLYEVAIAYSQPPYVYEFGNGDYYIRPPVAVSEAIPKASGGRVFRVLDSTGVPAALAEIASDINHQYRIDYTRPAAAAAPDLVDVSVQQSGLAVRATRFAPR